MHHPLLASLVTAVLLALPVTAGAQSGHPSGARGGILVPGARTLPAGTLSLGSYATFTRIGDLNRVLALGSVAYGVTDIFQLYLSRSSFFSGSGPSYFDYAGYETGHAFGPVGLTVRLPGPAEQPFQLALQAAVTPGIHLRSLIGHNLPYARGTFDVHIGLSQSLRAGAFDLRANEGYVITENTPTNPNYIQLGAGTTWRVRPWLGLEGEVLGRIENTSPIDPMEDYLAMSGGLLLELKPWLNVRGGYFLGLSQDRTDGQDLRAEKWGAYGSLEVQLWRPAGEARPRPQRRPPAATPTPPRPEPIQAVAPPPQPVGDADGDGVPDDVDLEPATPKGALVDAQGRALDTDGDGVPDGIDAEPDTPAGLPVDATGRGLRGLEADLITKGLLTLNTVYFNYNSAVIRPESYETLREVGLILGKYRELKIEVGGHSDNVGSDIYNRELSRARAEAVLDWLLQNIPELSLERFTVFGYGEDQPVADNATEEGRILNRRVSFRVLNPAKLEKYRPPGGSQMPGPRMIAFSTSWNSPSRNMRKSGLSANRITFPRPTFSTISHDSLESSPGTCGGA
jgi:outer membrane protein OmpA-like peptidoglycan-associated protein